MSYLKHFVLKAYVCIVLSSCVMQQINTPDLHEQQRARKLIDQGVLQLRSGQLPEAEASFQVALEIMSLAEGWDGLGAAAFLREDFRKAEDYYKKALEIDPFYSEAYSNLALLYEKLDQKAEAQKFYKKSIELNPQNFRARNNFAAYIYDQDGQEALQLVRAELRRAQALSAPGLVNENLDKLEE